MRAYPEHYENAHTLQTVSGKTFGEWASEIRRAKGVTQDDLSEIIGYSQSQISRAEKGGDVSTDYALAFARALGLDRALVLDKLHGEATNARSAVLAEISAEGVDLDLEDQLRLLEIVRALKRAKKAAGKPAAAGA